MQSSRTLELLGKCAVSNFCLGVDENFGIIEEFAALVPLKGSTYAAELYVALQRKRTSFDIVTSRCVVQENWLSSRDGCRHRSKAHNQSQSQDFLSEVFAECDVILPFGG